MKRYHARLACRALAAALAAAGALPAGASSPPTSNKATATTMKLRITIDGSVITATLPDNAASRQFAAMLPLDLTLNDYAATEKVGDLPQRLVTAGAPAGYTPRTGDIAYYAPWGNLALFHKDFAYSQGLIKLGSLDMGVDLLRRTGRQKARFELIGPAAR